MKKLLKTLLAAFCLTFAFGAISACGGGGNDDESSSIVNSSSEEVSSEEVSSEEVSSEEVSSEEVSSEKVSSEEVSSEEVSSEKVSSEEQSSVEESSKDIAIEESSEKESSKEPILPEESSAESSEAESSEEISSETSIEPESSEEIETSDEVIVPESSSEEISSEISSEQESSEEVSSEEVSSEEESSEDSSSPSFIANAVEVVDTLLTRPDAWSFMPEAFQKENLACESNPTLDFSSSFVNVSSINQNYMGAQMYVLWDGVVGLDSFLQKFDIVYALGETIATAYQLFLNDNPNDYASWQTHFDGFNIKIELDGKNSKLLVGNSTFSLELTANSETNKYTGRIQLANNFVAYYEMDDTSLLFNTSLEIKGVANMKQVQFVRNENAVSGYFYQYTGVEKVALKTSAVIAFNDDYAIVMSAKRESDDLLINGYEEVYSAKTGKLLSAEVEENNKLVTYDTHWVNIYDVVGITSVKAIKNDVDIDPSKNQHNVYINSSADIFLPEYNKIAFVKTSRHYDIEMKTVYYVVAVQNGDKVSYEVVETEVPMLFVQEKNIEDFGSEAKKNNDVFTSNPTLPTQKIAIAQNNYEALRTLLDTVKELITYEELHAVFGTRDPFFDAQ